MQLALQNIFRFIILAVVQVFVLDNIQFLGYITPMIYILFILSLPVRLHRGLSLILGFALGLTIDMFNNTAGLHAFATVFLAFFRNPVIRMFVSLEQNENPTPSFKTFGTSSYLKYVIALVVAHHTVLFLMESFSFLSLSTFIPKILLSSLVTFLLIAGIQSLKSR